MQKVQSEYSGRKFFLFYTTWWVAWSCIQTLVLHRLGLEWKVALADSFVSNILLGILSLSSIVLYRFYQPGKTNRMYRFVYALGISILFTMLFSWVMQIVIPQNPAYHKLVETSMPLRFVVALIILSFITLLNWMWSILQEQQKQELRNNESSRLIKEAELLRLRQQLQPHFLFNSLNSISALAGSQPEEARKMIQQLSDFLRGTLKKDEVKSVLFGEEIEHLKLYLEIEKVRFGHRLNIQLDISEECHSANIPPLLLQPLVENAIKFGLYGTVDKITVSITAHVDKSFLHVSVKNPFDAEMHFQKEGTGFGLSSIQRRLFLMYSRNDLLITTKDNGLFSSTLIIPQ